MCSPLAETKAKISCISDEIIRDLRLSLGIRSGNVEQVYQRIHKRLGTEPGQELHWVKATAIPSDLRSKIKESFRPQQPASWTSSSRQWLTTTDIANVLQQYTHLYSDFAFLGVHPIDFADPDASGQCVSRIMCDVSFDSLRKAGYKHAGVVFNLDEHTGQGTHWTSMYIGLDPKNKRRFGIFYYDSVGRPLPQRVSQYIESFSAGVSRSKRRFVHQNNVRKQFKDSECGIYAIAFIVMMLDNPYVPFDIICTHHMRDDDTMSQLREYFFNKIIS